MFRHPFLRLTLILFVIAAVSLASGITNDIAIPRTAAGPSQSPFILGPPPFEGSEEGSRQPLYGAAASHEQVMVRDLPPADPAALEREGPAAVPRRAPEIADAARADASQVPEANALDGSRRTVAGPPSLVTFFDGADADTNVDLTGFGVSPPDPQLAVGPDHVVEFINIVGRITDKAGMTVVPDFALRDFFGLPPGTLDTDPKIIYDDIDDRFFGTYIDFGPTEGHLYLAISATSDPTGAWNLYSLTCPDCIPDYEGIGVTDDKFTISVNLFSISTDDYLGEQTIVVQKSDVLAGAPSPDVAGFPPTLTRFTVRPAQNLSAGGSDQYLTTWDITGGMLPAPGITVIRVTGTPTAMNVTEAAATTLTTMPQTTPPPSDTAGSGDCFVFGSNLGPPPCIDSGDFRMLESIWRDGSLWSASGGACVPPGDGSVRSCAHLVEVETAGTPSVVQDIMYGAVGEYFSWPAIRTDASDNLFAVMTHTTPSIFAEARVAGRHAADPLGVLTPSSPLRWGEVAHFSGRWGDYLGAAVDPAAPTCVWVVGQYAKDTSVPIDWGTFIGSFTFGPDCGPAPDDKDSDSCTNVQELDSDHELGGQRDPNNFWDFFDVWTGEPPVRDGQVFGQDIGSIVARFGSSQDPPPTKNEALTQALTPPADSSSYHAAFDRTPLGPNAWNIGPPDGSIFGQDIGLVVAQFGDSCV